MLEKIPKTAVGKVQRSLVAKTGLEPQGRRVKGIGAGRISISNDLLNVSTFMMFRAFASTSMAIAPLRRFRISNLSATVNQKTQRQDLIARPSLPCRRSRKATTQMFLLPSHKRQFLQLLTGKGNQHSWSTGWLSCMMHKVKAAPPAGFDHTLFFTVNG